MKIYITLTFTQLKKIPTYRILIYLFSLSSKSLQSKNRNKGFSAGGSYDYEKSKAETYKKALDSKGEHRTYLTNTRISLQHHCTVCHMTCQS